MLVAALAIFAAPAFAKGHHHPKHKHGHQAKSVSATAQVDGSVAVTKDADKAWKKANWQSDKAQWKQYGADQAAYKESWSDEDVAKASADAPTTPCAAWPYINLANHLWDAGQSDSDEYQAAITQAKNIIGDFPGKAADSIRAIICNHDGPKGIGPCQKTGGASDDGENDPATTDGEAENKN